MTPTVRARALGAPGKSGNSILNYAGRPPDSFGNNGDYCIDTVNDILYGPKASGAWPGSGISLAPGQPTWAAPINSIGAITSTIPEHIVNSRALTANALQPNDVVEVVALLYIPPEAINDQKFVRFCIGEDSSNSLLEIFDAEIAGYVAISAQLSINAAAPHILRTRIALNQDQGHDIQRDEVIVDVSTALHLQTRIWVANGSDSVVVDAIYMRLNRTGL